MNHTPIESRKVSSGYSELPSIKTLFSESWALFQRKAFAILKLTIATLGLQLLATFVFFAIILILWFSVGLSNKFNLDNIMSNVSIPVIVGSFILALLFISASVIISIIYQSALLLALDSQEERTSVWQQLRKGVKYVVPLFIVGLITTFLVFGGMVVFILPGIFITYLIIFAKFRVVLHGEKKLTAIKKSFDMVGSQFGGILVRFALFLITYIFFIVFLPNLITKIDPQTGVIIAISLRFILNIIASWFSICYFFILYKHVASSYDEKRNISITWVWIVAIVGWIMLILASFGMYKILSTRGFSDFTKNNSKYSNLKVPVTLSPSREYGLEAEIFEGINKVRSVKNMEVLTQAQPLCAYATRRIKQQEDFGKFDDYAGFLEDTGKDEIWNTFFKGFKTVNTRTWTPVNSLTMSSDVVSAFTSEESKSSLADSKFTSACVRVSGKYLVIVYAGI